MNRSLLAVLTVMLCVGAYADDMMPVAGSTNGAYKAGSATTGTVSGTSWNFGGGSNASSIVYAGGPNGTGGGSCPDILDANSTCFSGVTPLDINLGSLTLDNGGNGGLGKGSYTAELDLTVTFTTPAVFVLLADPLTLTVDNGSKGSDLALTGLPSNSFTFMGETYTVTIDGLYSAATGGSLIDDANCPASNSNCLFVPNPGTGSASDTTGTAYLRGTVNSSGGGGIITSTPEPGSISLLLTALGGVVFAMRRKASRKGPLSDGLGC